LWNGVLIASGKMLQLLPISSSGLLLKIAQLLIYKSILHFSFIATKPSDMFSKEGELLINVVNMIFINLILRNIV
jgi:hypothetical protein